MAAGDYVSVVVLQNAAATALPGAIANIDGLRTILVEITGAVAGLTANFETSLDNGLNWLPVALLSIGSTTPGTLVIAATTTGIYRLQDCTGLKNFRARTTGTGTSMTVKAYGVSVQIQGV